MSRTESMTRVLDNVTESVLAESKKTMDDAHEEAERILEQAKKRTLDVADQLATEHEEKVESRIEKARSETQKERKRMVLRTVEEEVHEILDEADTRIREILSSPKGTDALERWILEGVEAMPGERAIVKVDSDTKGILDEVVEGVGEATDVELEVSDENLDPDAGVMVSSPDGNVVYNNTVDNRIEIFREELRRELTKMIRGAT